MKRVIFVYKPGVAPNPPTEEGEKRWAFWCDDVPPPVGGGPGPLMVPQMERIHETRDGEDYDCLCAQKLDSAMDVTARDILIETKTEPQFGSHTATSYLQIPCDGGRLGQSYISIRLLRPSQLYPGYQD